MKKSLALSFALYSPDEFTAFPRPEAETKEERDKGTWNKQDREGGEKTEGKGEKRGKCRERAFQLFPHSL